MTDAANDAARWLAEARAGSHEALGRLLDSCRGYLLLVAGRELDPQLQAKGGASDLVQETLLDAVRDFHHFEGDAEAELLAWLRRLLLNNLVSFTRLFKETGKRELKREVALDAGSSDARGPAPVTDTPSPSGEAIEREQAEAFRRAVQRLPEDYQRVILMRYQEGRSFKEIGQVLELSPNAARKLWVRAVKRLQQEMGEPP